MSASIPLKHRLSILALGAGLLLLTGGAPLWAQMPTVPKAVPLPVVTMPQAPLVAPTIVIPGQTTSGAKLADTLIYQGTVLSGDFCIVTTSAQSQTQTSGSATASATVSVTVVCDVQIVTTP